MGLKRYREDSIKERGKQKTIAQLQAENEALQDQVQALETQLEDTQAALCDIYEAMLGGES